MPDILFDPLGCHLHAAPFVELIVSVILQAPELVTSIFIRFTLPEFVLKKNCFYLNITSSVC